MAGVEFGGALKNVIAIAAGVVEGLGLGHNAMAALITRGLVEMSRLAGAEGGRRDTLAGLSGLGDLVLTCTGDLSRNRHVGIELGRGRALPEILAQMHMVAEGVRTTGAALALGARHGIELPIAAQMSAVLEGAASAARGCRRSSCCGRQRPEARPRITDSPWVFSTRSSSRSRAPRNSSSSGSTRSSRGADEPERRSRPVDVETIDALEEALISADVGVAATAQIVDAVRERARAAASRCAIS